MAIPHLLPDAELTPENRNRRLTQAEVRIVELVVLGQSNSQIASQLKCREQVIKNHLHRIFGKVGVENRTMLAYHWGGDSSSQATLLRQEREIRELRIELRAYKERSEKLHTQLRQLIGS